VIVVLGLLFVGVAVGAPVPEVVEAGLAVIVFAAVVGSWAVIVFAAVVGSWAVVGSRAVVGPRAVIGGAAVGTAVVGRAAEGPV
jgi:hypothetical protein